MEGGDEDEGAGTARETATAAERKTTATRKWLRRKVLRMVEKGLRAVLLMITMTAGGRWDGGGTTARGGGGVGSVALLLPNLAHGYYSARNPTVGIAAFRIVPGRARGLQRLRGNPPIPRVRYGLIAGKGTPRIPDHLLPGGVSLVMLLVILIPILSPSPVVAVGGHVTFLSLTRSGPDVVVVVEAVRRGAGRRGLGDGVRRRPDSPHNLNAPVKVAVEVTMSTTGHITATMIGTTTTVMRTPAGVANVVLSVTPAGKVGSGPSSDPAVAIPATADSGAAIGGRIVSRSSRVAKVDEAVTGQRVAHQGNHRRGRRRRVSAKGKSVRAALLQDAANGSGIVMDMPARAESNDAQTQSIVVSFTPPERPARSGNHSRGKDDPKAANGGRRMQEAPNQESGLADADAAEEAEPCIPTVRGPPTSERRLASTDQG